ncbi:max-binding protein MNT-like isoform X2 [Phyllopteryx taeniolatus]|uniref:max-binding protein MNT-like isoform X2 n=1 Tax=Phyllopteryx taeniolatus TaxID=161469 RepID=UPI002AD33B74|nr:max-binding protein MNT-like isoform X2 [Phyllopteryx taeniolatus]
MPTSRRREDIKGLPAAFWGVKVADAELRSTCRGPRFAEVVVRGGACLREGGACVRACCKSARASVAILTLEHFSTQTPNSTCPVRSGRVRSGPPSQPDSRAARGGAQDERELRPPPLSSWVGPGRPGSSDMSIDTLLEAARYLEWQAERDRAERIDRHAAAAAAAAEPQPRRLSHEEDQSKVKVLINTEAESRRSEAVSLQPLAANHVSRGERPPRPPTHPRVPVAVVPMVPVVTATPLSLIAMLPGSPPRAPPPPVPHQPLCSSQVKADAAKQPIGCGQSQQRPQVHAQYPPPVGGVDGPAPQTALASHQVPPTSHLRSNGLTLDDMRGGANGKRRSGGTGTREVHNKLEQNRRAHLKECFETLKKNVPNVDDKKTSNLSVLRSALRYIQTLKRKEKEYEHEMERLAREKIATQQRLSELKKELSQRMDAVEIERVIRQTVQPEDDQASTSTASDIFRGPQKERTTWSGTRTRRPPPSYERRRRRRQPPARRRPPLPLGRRSRRPPSSPARRSPPAPRPCRTPLSSGPSAAPCRPITSTCRTSPPPPAPPGPSDTSRRAWGRPSRPACPPCTRRGCLCPSPPWWATSRTPSPHLRPAPRRASRGRRRRRGNPPRCWRPAPSWWARRPSPW